MAAHTDRARRRPPALRWVAPVLAASLVGAAGIGLASSQPGLSRARGTAEAPVHVVDAVGRPLAGAIVSTGSGRYTTGPDGRVVVPAPTDGFVRVSREGLVPRVVGIHPATDARAVLLPAAEGAVSLRFGGDVMMGRRFYEEPAVGGKPPLTETSTVGDHARLLQGIAPLIADADLTAVNLETPLVEHPYWPLGSSRPRLFDQTKDVVLASSPRTAAALKATGVDVVSLANDHVYDAGQEGLASTLRALDAAHVAHYGAGLTEDDAWRPLVVPVRNRAVAFVGCTTVAGGGSNVASGAKGGAARCATDRLVRIVREQKAAGHDVVVTVHGGVEYRREQQEAVRALTRAAVAAGAVAVMNSHPHVVGGLTQVGGAAVVESLGNLVFDQVLWTTQPSYLARVDLRDGAMVAAQADPIVLDRFRPQPASAAVADDVTRIAAGVVPGAAEADATAAVVGSAAAGADGSGSVRLIPGAPVRLAAGWVAGQAVPGVRLGTDLLYGSGRFEGTDGGGDPPLWQLGANARRSNAAACVPAQESAVAQRGVEIVRSPVSTQDAYAAAAHRIPVRAGQRLTLFTSVRHASAEARVELAWFSESDGGSQLSTSGALPLVDTGAAGCRQARVDVEVPRGMRYVQPVLRVLPPSSSLRGARLAVDDLSLVAWDQAPGPQVDTIMATTRPVTYSARHVGSVGSVTPGDDHGGTQSALAVPVTTLESGMSEVLGVRPGSDPTPAATE